MGGYRRSDRNMLAAQAALRYFLVVNHLEQMQEYPM